MKVIPYTHVIGSDVATLTVANDDATLTASSHREMDAMQLVIVDSYQAYADAHCAHLVDTARAQIGIKSLRTQGQPMDYDEASALIPIQALYPSSALAFDVPLVKSSGTVDIEVEASAFADAAGSVDIAFALFGNPKEAKPGERGATFMEAVGSNSGILSEADDTVDLALEASKDLDAAFLVCMATPLVKDAADVVNPFPVITKLEGVGDNLNLGKGTSVVPVAAFSQRSGLVGLDVAAQTSGSEINLRVELSSALPGGSTTQWAVMAAVMVPA